MIPRQYFYHRLAVLLVCLAAAGATAQGTARISDLSSIDLQYMEQQRVAVNDLAARNFGSQFRGELKADLQLLQQLLDQRIIGPDQTRELQAMGVILGDLLAAQLGMHWVVYEDALGRSRALRYLHTDEYLFPVTMISRRREAGNQTPVAVIYQKAYDIIAPLRPALPFQ